MDYTLIISSSLKIDVSEFISSWNQDPDSKIIAHAQHDLAKSFPIADPELLRTGVVILSGIVSNVALDLLKDLIKNRIKKFLEERSDSEETAAKLEIAIPEVKGSKAIIVIWQIGDKYV